MPSLNTSACALWITILLSTTFNLFVSHAAVYLGSLMFPLFALALELPENYFEDKASPQGRHWVYSSDLI